MGKWILRAWHLLMLLFVVGGLARVAPDAQHSDAAGVGMVVGLMILLVIWACGALIIKSFSSAFSRQG
jgi:hypothetical protein